MRFRFFKLLFVIVLAFSSCSENKNQQIIDSEKVKNTELKDQPTDVLDTDVKAETALNENPQQAEKWLKSAIEAYFNQELNDWSFMTTAEYNEYKIDMINSVYVHGIELDSLRKKWSFKYEVTEKRIGVGFLIGAQDYSNIVIKTCNLLSSNEKGGYFFKLILCDTDYDQCYESDVTIVEYEGSYAIDNVKEYYR